MLNIEYTMNIDQKLVLLLHWLTMNWELFLSQCHPFNDNVSYGFQQICAYHRYRVTIIRNGKNE